MAAHKMAIHAENYKKGSVGALEHHNLRENGSYSNKDIDPGRTKDNIILRQPGHTQYQDTKQIIEQRAVNQVRSTSIWQSEFIVSSDKEFFQGLPKAEQDRFFREAYDFLCGEFGEENVTCAVVHYDETTPHMHFDFVPMTPDNKLSRKEVMTRERLLSIQDRLPKYMQQQGFDIQRGQKMAQMEPKDRPRHIEPAEYKKSLNERVRALERHEKHLDTVEARQMERRNRLAADKKQLDSKAAVLNESLQGMRELPQAEKSFTGKMQLPEQEYQQLYAAAQYGMASRQQRAELQKENRQLKQAYSTLQKENKDLKRLIPSVQEKLAMNKEMASIDHLRRENTFLKNILGEISRLPLPDQARQLIEKVTRTARLPEHEK